MVSFRLIAVKDGWCGVSYEDVCAATPDSLFGFRAFEHPVFLTPYVLG